MVYVLIAVTLLWIVFAAVAVLGVWFGGSWLRFRQYHRKKGLPLPDGPRWSDRIGHWLREAEALFRIHQWRLERGARQLTGDPDGDPVMCVHGFTQDRTNFSALRRLLWQAGRPSLSVDLGIPGKHPRHLAEPVIAALQGLISEHPDQPIDVVCHSMGGLVLREALAQRPDLATALRTIVTLGSPHQGTAGARWPVRIWPEAGGLARRSPWVADLRDFAELAPDVRAVTISGSADYIVYPSSTCHLPGSEQVDFHGIGHAGLLTDSRVLDVVMAAFDGEDLPSRPGMTYRPSQPDLSPAAPRTQQA